jgi:hypothetical protein
VLTSDGPLMTSQSIWPTGSRLVPLMKESHCGIPRSKNPIVLPTGFDRISSAFTTTMTRTRSA